MVEELAASLNESDVVEGVVTRVMEYGAFVSLRSPRWRHARGGGERPSTCPISEHVKGVSNEIESQLQGGAHVAPI